MSNVAAPGSTGEVADADGEPFEHARPLLSSLAYQMLGSVVDAEDIVQEAYLRWRRSPPRRAESSRAYLSTIVTRLCLDHLKSARVRREEYVGPWLPEPLVGPVEEDYLETMARADSLSMAFLLLLERLSPRERAVFLLREVFSFDYADIARIIGRSEAATRQIARRARDKVPSGAARFSASREEAHRLTRRFVDACESGNLDGLIELLTEDAVARNDGGGKTRAARNAVHGSDRVARLFVGLFRKWSRLQTRMAQVNGQPGVLVQASDGRRFVISFAVRDGRIQGVFLVANPDKLRRVPAIL